MQNINQFVPLKSQLNSEYIFELDESCMVNGYGNLREKGCP